MKKNLNDICYKPYGSHKVKLPVVITEEDRNRKMKCLSSKDIMNKTIGGEKVRIESFRTVSMYTCLKCKHFQLRSEAGVELTRSCGVCVFPKKADKHSREITQSWSASNDFDEDGTVKLTERKERAKREKKPGGYQDKVGRIAQLIEKELSKESIKAGLLKKFPTTKDTTFNTMWYAAKKLIKEGKVPVDKIEFPEPPIEAHVVLSYFAMLEAFPADRTLAISYKWPSFYKGENYVHLFPPQSLVIKYKNALKKYPEREESLNRKYTKKYYDSVLNTISERKTLLDIKGKVLLCWESPDKFCHRSLIKEWLEDFDPSLKIVEAPKGLKEVKKFINNLEWLDIELTPQEQKANRRQKQKERKIKIAKELGISLENVG